MPFGYIGQNQPKQLVKNAGVVDVMHHGILSKKKHKGLFNRKTQNIVVLFY